VGLTSKKQWGLGAVYPNSLGANSAKFFFHTRFVNLDPAPSPSPSPSGQTGQAPLPIVGVALRTGLFFSSLFFFCPFENTSPRPTSSPLASFGPLRRWPQVHFWSKFCLDRELARAARLNRSNKIHSSPDNVYPTIRKVPSDRGDKRSTARWLGLTSVRST
jgi:hypothetical protein